MTRTATELPVLSRKGAPAPPVRIVHLGLGAFHRSHQAWFTAHASDAAEWGIASFTGRRPDAALALAPQDGLFTLIERAADGDRFEVVPTIAEAVDGADTERLNELLAAPSTAIVTLTVTEKVYDDGGPDSPLGRLARGLAARRDAGAGPIAIVSCDNVAGNGDVARAAVERIAQAVDPGLAAWVRENASFVGTSVDRITPRTTPDDVALVAERCGYRDASPVVAEPFASWILSGEFPGGRPAWEDAGAQFVEDIEPFENRKLWLLNGAHTMLAYAGQLRGHATVAEALADPVCRDAMEAFWDEAARHLTLPALDVPGYRAALVERFANPRIAHYLAQIAQDGSLKLRMRAVPVLRAERAEGRSGIGAARMIAAWMDYLVSVVGQRAEFHDPLEEEVRAALALEGRERTVALLGLVDADLAGEAAVVDRVDSLLGTFAED
ncbi:mannitol dehydrogenase family protein [Sinomonas sp. JGH33]|uniref:Mannitol dehydrogenase family protein n=1 Tax=Sinomonas terricola TaxID=3110330 RepID=A0ABU5T5Y3_9MICC|nr:mannitol dehydrogenase family protein [Sinomonas sp. JGH33]MEA5455087.1 mannitol dehydrogenase family protein [Sinomonas sp. JGH33]